MGATDDQVRGMRERAARRSPLIAAFVLELARGAKDDDELDDTEGAHRILTTEALFCLTEAIVQIAGFRDDEETFIANAIELLSRSRSRTPECPTA